MYHVLPTIPCAIHILKDLKWTHVSCDNLYRFIIMSNIVIPGKHFGCGSLKCPKLITDFIIYNPYFIFSKLRVL